MSEETKCIVVNWQAFAAIATLFAVIVALVPIWREARRVKARARSLRFRLCSKLSVLRPSLGAVIKGGASSHPDAVLSKEEFRKVVRSIADMMQETAALETEEQDQVGVVLANLEMSAVLYGTDELKSDSAQNVVSLIDRAIAVMEENGLTTGTTIKPWNE